MSRFPDVRFLVSAASPAQFPPDHGVEVAFAGRSNAGKSSAINVITQRHALARTSKIPGRTRLLNFFQLAADARIVDLPGYGYANVPGVEREKWEPMLEALRRRYCLRGLFLVVDVRRGLASTDAELISWVASPQRHIHVLLTKADKLSRAESAKALREARAVLEGRATAQLFSALGRSGVEEAQDLLASWSQSVAKEKTPVTSQEITGAD